MVLTGIAGSPGVGVGPAIVLGPRRLTFVQRQVRTAEHDGEVARFRQAVVDAKLELMRLSRGAQPGGARAEVSILEAYTLMLGDELLAEAVERNVRVERQCAEWAVSTAITDFARKLALQEDAYLRERSHDFEFVGERLILALTGATSTRALPPLEEPSVVIAHDLSSADLLSLDPKKILGVATEVGTKTSHTAIVARALGLPAVMGACGLVDNVVSGDAVVVDGLRGTVTLRPSEDTARSGLARGERHLALTRHLRSDAARPGALASGERVGLFANIEFAKEAGGAIEHGADGVGLYRTEFLYLGRTDLPSEEEQLEQFRRVLEVVDGRPVTLRTFDLGGDKPFGRLAPPPEPNPALGLRAVRLGLRHPDVLVAQLRAMIRASAFGDVRVMVPMIATLREWVDVRRLFSQALADVDREGSPRATRVPFGSMIEVPSAAVLSDALAQAAEFVSVGTNDLVQYTLAVDRTSPGLASLASHFDPAVLRLLSGVASSSSAAGCPASVCGAMAADPLAALLLVGLGFRALSMEPGAIPEVKEALSRVTLSEVTEAATGALRLTSADEIEHALAVSFAPRLFDLLSGDEANAPGRAGRS
ncbi:MAG: phosphoenolpyruvate--protein phosphotransferase [Polyangiaceae bacterium]|nr:phosphoenolpyruvate--protein phosphotransferase [Polyangiaceae bacterium]